MGTLTQTELQDEVRSALGGRTDLDSRMTRGLNLSQMRIARLSRWEELEAIYTGSTAYTGTPADDKFLALPTNLRDVYSVRLIDGTNSRKLTRLTNRIWDRRIPAPEALATGRPRYYTLHRNVMEFWKVPDAAYSVTIRAVEWPTAFTTSDLSAVSDLDQKDDMIIALTTSWFYMTLGNEEMANKWWRIYRNMAIAAGAEESEKPDLDVLPNAGVSSGGTPGDYYADPFVTSVVTEG